MFVTLNTTRPIREELIYDTNTFMHPIFDVAAINAQRQIAAMNGTNGTWFCGAWMKNGFHEDGLSEPDRPYRRNHVPRAEGWR